MASPGADVWIVLAVVDLRDRASSKAHVIRWPAALANDKQVALFVAWIAKQAAKITFR